MTAQKARGLIRMMTGMALMCAWGTAAFAHIKNEASQFPDIEYSESRFDIVVLVGAGIIPETPVFEPDKNLSRKELATWIALARDLGQGGETPDTDALADEARKQGVVPSLDGDATYEEINALFLHGEGRPADAAANPTKAEAASFIAASLDTGAGRALLLQHGIRAGSTGTVKSVTAGDGHHGNAYSVTVGDVSMPLFEHGRVANGPTDILQWEGREIRRSFVRGEGRFATWTYLEAAPKAEPAMTAAADTATTASEPPPPRNRTLLYWLIAGVVVLGLLMFFQRRRHR